MEFRVWIEASVSSERLGEAIEKTLRFMVDGEWSFQDRGSVVWNSGDSRKIQIRKTSDLIRNGIAFRLSLDAGFSENKESIGIGPFSHKQYDTLDGIDDLEIKCMLWREGELIGKKGFSGDVSGRSQLGKSLPFKNPMELAAWVNEMTKDLPEDRGDDDDPDDNPDRHSPSPENKLVSV
jgi:hypothetical protein